MRAGRNRFALDAELFLKNDKAAAITATETTSYFNLTLATAEWANGEVSSKQEFVVVVHVETLDDTTGDETYTFALKVANADASVSKNFSSTAVTEPGQYVLPITREQIDTVAAGEKIAVVATLAGTTPSVKYFAYVAPFFGIGH